MTSNFYNKKQPKKFNYLSLPNLPHSSTFTSNFAGARPKSNQQPIQQQENAGLILGPFHVKPDPFKKDQVLAQAKLETELGSGSDPSISLSDGKVPEGMANISSLKLACFPLKMIEGGKLPDGMIQLVVNGNQVMVKKDDYQKYSAFKSKKILIFHQSNGKVPDGMVRLLVNEEEYMVEKLKYFAHQQLNINNSEVFSSY